MYRPKYKRSINAPALGLNFMQPDKPLPEKEEFDKEPDQSYRHFQKHNKLKPA